MKLNAIIKNKETQEEEIFELSLENEEIACLYEDQHGIAVSTRKGSVFRVTQTMKELQEQL
jgi:hypothetical protein